MPRSHPDYTQDNILSGRQTTTIVRGTVDYRPDDVVMLVSIGAMHPFVVQATITQVRHCTFGQVTRREYAPFEHPDTLMFMMEPHLEYHDSPAANDRVTVVRWANLRGHIIDINRGYYPLVRPLAPGRSKLLPQAERMRPPTALLIAPNNRMRQNIVTERKQISLREGYRDYQPGDDMYICCHLQPWAVGVTVSAVQHCPLADVAAAQYRADGFRSRKAMLNGMRGFYPNLTEDSGITTLEWQKVRGYRVDRYQFDQEHR
jgi:hypothetical protein